MTAETGPARQDLPADGKFLPEDALARARTALDRASEVTWPVPDWAVIVPALAEAEQHLHDAGLMGRPELMMYTHLAQRAAKGHRGNDTRWYIDNIRSYLPARAAADAGSEQDRR